MNNKPLVVLLDQFQSVSVRLDGTDGEFTITYAGEELKVEADLPDSSGRQGVIYSEKFGSSPSKLDDSEDEPIDTVEDARKMIRSKLRLALPIIFSFYRPIPNMPDSDDYYYYDAGLDAFLNLLDLASAQLGQPPMLQKGRTSYFLPVVDQELQQLFQRAYRAQRSPNFADLVIETQRAEELEHIAEDIINLVDQCRVI